MGNFLYLKIETLGKMQTEAVWRLLRRMLAWESKDKRFQGSKTFYPGIDQWKRMNENWHSNCHRIKEWNILDIIYKQEK